MRNDKPNLIVDKTVQVSLAIIRYCELLNKAMKFIIAKQLLRSATGIGANVFEAQNAESKTDFVHKMKFAAKEASETQYWLLLCEKGEGFPVDTGLAIELEQIIKILTKIIVTTKAQLKENRPTNEQLKKN